MLLRGPDYIARGLGTSGIFATTFCQILVTSKKVLPSERGTPGTVPYGELEPGYCITFLKRIDEGLR